jgi:hypothetical protein
LVTAKVAAQEAPVCGDCEADADGEADADREADGDTDGEDDGDRETDADTEGDGGMGLPLMPVTSPLPPSKTTSEQP